MALNKNYIKQLKLDNSTAPMIEENLTAKYRIQILHRGENLFYYDKHEDRALIIPIDVRNQMGKSIFMEQLKKWDSGNAITEYEKEIIFKRVENYFKTYQKRKAFK